MKAIDLFAGIGGFHYAAAQNNIEVVFASEIDKYAVWEYDQIMDCARLQVFPDSHKIGVSDSQAYKQFGNAVTVNVVAEILKRIKILEAKK